MEITKDLLLAGEVFDHIMTTDVSARGSISKLYKSARKKMGMPLALAAAMALSNKVKRGDFVFFLTGFILRPQFSPKIAESDGPPGIAILARAIYKTIGAVPVILVEESIAEKVASVMQAAGFFFVPVEKASESAKLSPRPSQAAVLQTFPVDAPDPLSIAAKFLEQFSPSAIISSERGGPNHCGIVHNAQGKDVSLFHARSDLLVKLAYENDSGPLTIGIGDGGNEIGMGTIAEDLSTWLPYGAECECPCKGGIIPETKVDFLVTSSVSNWGASAIAAALALLNEMPEAAPNSELEKSVIRSCALNGFIDGPTGKVDEMVDGMPIDIHAAIAGMLEQTVIFGLKKSLWKYT